MRRHTTSSNGRDADLRSSEGGFKHLPLAQIDGYVLASARTPKDQIASSHLACGHPTTLVVLCARIFRQFDADTCERENHQTGTIKSDGSSALVNATRWSAGIATAPGVWNAQLRHSSANRELDCLLTVYPRYLAGYRRRGCGRLRLG